MIFSVCQQLGNFANCTQEGCRGQRYGRHGCACPPLPRHRAHQGGGRRMRCPPSLFSMHLLTSTVLILSFSRPFGGATASAQAEWRAQEGPVPLEGWLASHLLPRGGGQNCGGVGRGWTFGLGPRGRCRARTVPGPSQAGTEQAVPGQLRSHGRQRAFQLPHLPGTTPGAGDTSLRPQLLPRLPGCALAAPECGQHRWFRRSGPLPTVPGAFPRRPAAPQEPHAV